MFKTSHEVFKKLRKLEIPNDFNDTMERVSGVIYVIVERGGENILPNTSLCTKEYLRSSKTQLYSADMFCSLDQYTWCKCHLYQSNKSRKPTCVQNTPI